MFFPEKITNIKPSDKVLEVGPGGTPHPRSDVLLEKKFNEAEAKAQRGNSPPLETDKELVIYHGGKFPFGTNEFDYVICSHVLEHVPSDDVEFFAEELRRVARSGYIEYPLIYYDYIFDIPEHVTLFFFNKIELVYMPKTESGIGRYTALTRIFRDALEAGYTSWVDDLKEFFFQGFEWFDSLNLRRTKNISELVFDAGSKQIQAHIPSKITMSYLSRAKNKIKRMIHGCY